MADENTSKKPTGLKEGEIKDVSAPGPTLSKPKKPFRIEKFNAARALEKANREAVASQNKMSQGPSHLIPSSSQPAAIELDIPLTKQNVLPTIPKIINPPHRPAVRTTEKGGRPTKRVIGEYSQALEKRKAAIIEEKVSIKRNPKEFEVFEKQTRNTSYKSGSTSARPKNPSGDRPSSAPDALHYRSTSKYSHIPPKVECGMPPEQIEKLTREETPGEKLNDPNYNSMFTEFGLQTPKQLKTQLSPGPAKTSKNSHSSRSSNYSSSKSDHGSTYSTSSEIEKQNVEKTIESKIKQKVKNDGSGNHYKSKEFLSSTSSSSDKSSPPDLSLFLNKKVPVGQGKMKTKIYSSSSSQGGSSIGSKSPTFQRLVNLGSSETGTNKKIVLPPQDDDKFAVAIESPIKKLMTQASPSKPKVKSFIAVGKTMDPVKNILPNKKDVLFDEDFDSSFAYIDDCDPSEDMEEKLDATASSVFTVPSFQRIPKIDTRYILNAKFVNSGFNIIMNRQDEETFLNVYNVELKVMDLRSLYPNILMTKETMNMIGKLLDYSFAEHENEMDSFLFLPSSIADVILRMRDLTPREELMAIAKYIMKIKNEGDGYKIILLPMQVNCTDSKTSNFILLFGIVASKTIRVFDPMSKKEFDTIDTLQSFPELFTYLKTFRNVLNALDIMESSTSSSQWTFTSDPITGLATNSVFARFPQIKQCMIPCETGIIVVAAIYMLTKYPLVFTIPFQKDLRELENSELRLFLFNLIADVK